MKELQEWFWLQVELKAPETYIAAGDTLILATQRRELYKRVMDAYGGGWNGV
ncbi:MAG: hypothetical protein ACJ74J_13590 [Blastocatellia bacterium]